MVIHVKRIANVKPVGGAKAYCIGHLYIDGRYFCDTLEPYDRGLSKDSPVDVIRKHKVAGCTAIPVGCYVLDFSTFSNRFGYQEFYVNACAGRLPRLRDVPCFEGVLIHCGNYPRDTQGCLLVGLNKAVGQVLQSRETFRKLYTSMKEAVRRGEQVSITYHRTYECK